MQMTDEEIKDVMLQRLTATNEELVAMIVRRHLDSSPNLRIKMAIWTNADEQPWQNGVTLLEVCGNIAVDENPDFSPLEFPPSNGWPRIRTIWSSVPEFAFDEKNAKTNQYKSFAAQLEEDLISGKARIVFPRNASLNCFNKLREEVAA